MVLQGALARRQALRDLGLADVPEAWQNMESCEHREDVGTAGHGDWLLRRLDNRFEAKSNMMHPFMSSADANQVMITSNAAVVNAISANYTCPPEVMRETRRPGMG